MNIQTYAVFKKEFIAFFRTQRFTILAIVFIALAALSPILYSGLGSMLDTMTDVYDSMGMEVDFSGLTEYLPTAASTGVAMSVSDITTTALIVFILLINRAAGGEQKKRAVIIPDTAGLKSFPYLFPKYIVYPLSVFILCIVSMFVSMSVSISVYDINDLTASRVFLTSVIVGTSAMLYVCCHLTLGTATGRSGMSAAVSIAGLFILPNIFAFSGVDYAYNPFALNSLAGAVITNTSLTGDDIRDVIITLCFTFAIMVILFYIALFAQNAKKTDNSGNEIEL